MNSRREGVQPRSSAVAAILIVVAAFALQRGMTLPWARASAPDGARYELTVVGLSQIPASPHSPRVDCRWWPMGKGQASLCTLAPNGAGAFTRLRMVYPLLQIALWTAVVALFLQVFRRPRAAGARAAITGSVALVTVAALTLFVSAAPRALEATSPLELRYSGIGCWLCVLAAFFTALGGLLQIRARGELPTL